MALSTGETKAAAAQNERRMLVRAVEGRYRVAELLSKGGMGSIYRGWENGLERHVAIKLLAPGRAMDPDERGRFRREGRILASLAHRNIIPVLATGEQGDASWFSMPCMAGTLAQLLQNGARLPAETVRDIMVALADALAYVHHRGIIHRDIKAENILLDEAGRPVVSDFGVAILRTSEHSRAEAVKGYGTPEYMAPEQFLGTTDFDGRQDLYSLGVLGFRMLTGRFPLEGSQQQIAAAHVTREIPTVRGYAADVPKDLAAAIDRCLMRNPLDRWHDAAALREALRGRTARPSGRVVRLVRRMFHRIPAVAALL
jgi:serine/threonine-protein kinase